MQEPTSPISLPPVCKPPQSLYPPPSTWLNLACCTRVDWAVQALSFYPLLCSCVPSRGLWAQLSPSVCSLFWDVGGFVWGIMARFGPRSRILLSQREVSLTGVTHRHRPNPLSKPKIWHPAESVNGGVCVCVWPLVCVWVLLGREDDFQSEVKMVSCWFANIPFQYYTHQIKLYLSHTHG